MTHHYEIKLDVLVARAGLRADKIPNACQVENCGSKVAYLIMDYNDSSFYPRGICITHTKQYRALKWKREELERLEREKHGGKINLPKGAQCSICEGLQSVNDYNLVTCPQGHVNAKTVKIKLKPGPKPA